MDGMTLFIGLMSGLIGFAYFAYGKKRKQVVPLVSGLLMCVLPYVITDNVLTVVVCVVLGVIPFFLKF